MQADLSEHCVDLGLTVLAVLSDTLLMVSVSFFLFDTLTDVTLPEGADLAGWKSFLVVTTAHGAG